MRALLPLLTVIFLGVQVFSPISVHAAPIPRDNVLDPYLGKMMANGPPSLEVIVRFSGPLATEDLLTARECGLEIRHTFSAIPAIFAVGDTASVARFSQYNRVVWMEYNERLQYFMDRSLLTINATLTWDTKIVEKGGAESAGIDGTGVTAVVLDSGIDAGHPDLDYGRKVIMNLKSDSDLVWVEMENTDTSSGHGTHCAGTVGGTGDASGGTRSGVAKGAQLIGLSTGEAVAILNALGALEWVYQHSRPGNNPYNIRVVSNSWGTTSEYNHEDAIVQVSEKLTYENNVNVIFAAGNDGGSDHDGSTRTTNPYSLTPCVVSIAATGRDGAGVATFSSRGLATDNFTWPDVGAPGVNIWSTAARRTLITAMRAQDGDAYYMAISGTSMATPHVSGVTALLWQACPSMRVSEISDDYGGNGQYDNATYWNDSLTKMHEAEVIFKLTADYINKSGDNGVPENASRNLAGLRNDFAQGYGLVNVHRAIGLALALQELRRTNPDVTVLQAYTAYTGIFINRTITRATDTLTGSWHGEWARFDGNNGSAFYTSQVRKLFIPPGASKLILEMQYSAMNLDDRTAGTLGLRVDTNGDGSPDFTGELSPTVTGTRREEIAISDDGIHVGVDVTGRGFALKHRPTILPGSASSQYWEASIEYAITATLVFGATNGTLERADYYPHTVQWSFGKPSDTYNGGNLSMVKDFYDKANVTLRPRVHPPAGPAPGIQWWLIGVLAIVIGAGLGYREAKKRKLFEKKRGT